MGNVEEIGYNLYFSNDLGHLKSATQCERYAMGDVVKKYLEVGKGEGLDSSFKHSVTVFLNNYFRRMRFWRILRRVTIFILVLFVMSD